MTNKSTNPWFSTQPKPHAKLRLFCVPYAGGGNWIFQTWMKSLPESVEVRPIQLPGRGPRIKDPLFRQLVPFAEAIAEGILSDCNRPFAFFGHSMGAMLSFEIARYLRRAYQIKPVRLFVAGRRAPQIPDTDPPSYNLPESEFIEELRRIKGTPNEVLEHPELMQMMIPILRSDFEVCQTYECIPDRPLDCPISAFGGLEDDEETRERIEPWREQTTNSFSLHMLPGDHFFLHTSESLLLRLLSEQLRELVA